MTACFITPTVHHCIIGGNSWRLVTSHFFPAQLWTSAVVSALSRTESASVGTRGLSSCFSDDYFGNFQNTPKIFLAFYINLMFHLQRVQLTLRLHTKGYWVEVMMMMTDSETEYVTRSVFIEMPGWPWIFCWSHFWLRSVQSGMSLWLCL